MAKTQDLMGSASAEMKVFIVGAGVAGLALAQILRKHGVAFGVFERDSGARPQGWSVGLDKCLPDLRTLLPNDLEPIEAASPNFVVGKGDSYGFVHSRTHETLGVIGADLQAAGKAPFISAERVQLRRILMQHLDVQYSKRLVSFQQSSNGVTATFADGSTAHGSILVGADGGNSIVRSQLLPSFESTPSAYVILHGNMVLSPEEYMPLLEIGKTGVIIGEPRLRAYLILAEYLSDGQARWQWGVARSSEQPEQMHAWADAASAEELRRRAVEWTGHFPPWFRHAIENTGLDGMQVPPVKLRETVLPEDVLPDGLVTLLGDAAHSMVPFRGMGANTALQDACDLGTVLVKAAKEGGELHQALWSYECTMIPRGRNHVLESRASDVEFDMAGGRLKGPDKPADESSVA